MNDGAVAILLGDEKRAMGGECRDLLALAGRRAPGIEPHLSGLGPVIAAQQALAAVHRLG